MKVRGQDPMEKEVTGVELGRQTEGGGGLANEVGWSEWRHVRRREEDYAGNIITQSSCSARLQLSVSFR